MIQYELYDNFSLHYEEAYPLKTGYPQVHS